ncbi:MAG: FGGY-family carbohydrate kinase [Vallitalea sp.]|jgi:xylulokinase|nr:FGGY-family carbohydrate kinase [Vallitalea sp.]
MTYIIAYDLGTGGIKASLFDIDGKSLSSSFFPCRTYYPEENFREQKPEDWWKSVVNSTRDLINKTEIDIKNIKAIAVSGHSLGAVPIGYSGELLSEYVPIWSDSRATEEANKFFKIISEKEWYEKTGNGFPPSLYAVFKIMWYKEHCRELFEKTCKFIGTKDYINYKMTGILATDYSYASGSGVFDLKKWEYDEELIKASGILKDKFPDLYESTHILGTIKEKVANELGLPKTIKVACGGVDNSCMALGAGCIDEGMSYTSLGTSAWVAVTSSQPVIDIDKRPYVFAHCIKGMYASATAIFSAGNSYRWIRDNVCKDIVQVEKNGGVDSYEKMNELAKTSPIGSKKLIFNPSLAGGSSIDESQNIRGAYIGLTLGHTQADLIRAGLEGITLGLQNALEVLEAYVKLDNNMLIVGGGSKSPFWRQLFADIYNKNILYTKNGQQTGSLGAAAIAFVGCGLWKDFSLLKEINTDLSIIKPQEENVTKYKKINKVFKKVAKMQSEIGEILANL